MSKSKFSKQETVGSGESPEISETKTSDSQTAEGHVRDIHDSASEAGPDVIGLQLLLRSRDHAQPELWVHLWAHSDITGLPGDVCAAIGDDFVQLFSKWASAHDLHVQIANSPLLFESKNEKPQA